MRMLIPESSTRSSPRESRRLADRTAQASPQLVPTGMCLLRQNPWGVRPVSSGLTIAAVSLTRNTGVHSIVSERERVFPGVERKK
jgi:hypothetical protein